MSAELLTWNVRRALVSGVVPVRAAVRAEARLLVTGVVVTTWWTRHAGARLQAVKPLVRLAGGLCNH